MRKGNLIVLLGMVLLTSCVSSEQQVREAIKRDPQILFSAIDDNPEEFLEVVNRAAQKAQERKFAKQMSEMKAQQERDLQEPKKPHLVDERRLIGTDSSKIIIVEYADFQCPACRLAYATLLQFKEKYKGQIQFYFKNMPLDFHPLAYPAAQYFEAIRLQSPQKALKFYEYVFENQKKLNESGFLDKVAKLIGADAKKLATDIKSDQVQRIIQEDMQEFQSFRFTGTPVIILNGVALPGAQRFEDLERVLQLTQNR